MYEMITGKLVYIIQITCISILSVANDSGANFQFPTDNWSQGFPSFYH